MGQRLKFNTENEDLKLFKKHDTKSKRLQSLDCSHRLMPKGTKQFYMDIKCNYSKFLIFSVKRRFWLGCYSALVYD